VTESDFSTDRLHISPTTSVESAWPLAHLNWPGSLSQSCWHRLIGLACPTLAFSLTVAWIRYAPRGIVTTALLPPIFNPRWKPQYATSCGNSVYCFAECTQSCHMKTA